MAERGVIIHGDDDEVWPWSPSVVVLRHGWGNNDAKAGTSPQLEHGPGPLCARGIELMSVIRGMKNLSHGDR